MSSRGQVLRDLETFQGAAPGYKVLVTRGEGESDGLVPVENIVTSETLLDKLKGEEADPERIGMEFLPPVLGSTQPTMISPAPPANPQQGQSWVDSDEGILSHFWDGYWVVAEQQPVAPPVYGASSRAVLRVTPVEGQTIALLPGIDQTLYLTPASALNNLHITFPAAASFEGMTVIIFSTQDIGNLGYNSGWNSFVGVNDTGCPAKVPRSFQCVELSASAVWLCL